MHLQVCHVVFAAGGCGVADIAGVGLVAAWAGSICGWRGRQVLGGDVTVGGRGIGVRGEAPPRTCMKQ